MSSPHDSPVDVLLVNPPSPDGFVYIRDINRHGRSSWERMLWPQTNLAYLAAVAETLGLSVDIIDCIAESISWADYVGILERCRPRFCFSNVISATYRNDIRALRAAKRVSGAVTIGLGPHLTDAPGPSLLESPGLDFVIHHEPEETARELLALLASSAEPEAARLAAVSGIAFIPGRIRPGGAMVPVTTPQRPFIKDLDTLPWPRHDLLPLDRYWAPFLGRYAFVEASRGCHYRCIFCRQAVMWQWKYRRRSAASVAREALYVHSLGVPTILFHADTFTLDTAFVSDLCDILIAAGSPFRWACNTHVKNLFGKPELVGKMKAAGCWMIAVGIESGDDTVLENIQKQITAAQAESVVRMIDAAGIEAWGYFVLGLPGDTRRTMAKTIRFACQLPLKIAKFDIAAPYPGTAFHAWTRRHGYLKIDRAEDFDQNASAVVEYPHLPRTLIKSAARRGNLHFFLRPSRLAYLIRRTTDRRTLTAMLLIARDLFRLLGSGGRKK